MDSYSTVVFIDTMVVLESHPLAQLPWQEIDIAGPILLLVLPQVQSEIDKRKRDGRLAERARAFSRLIAPSVVERKPVRIADKRVVVDIALAACDPVDYERLDLDRNEGDHRVVGQMLNVRGIDLARSILISHDVNPIAVAIRHDLRTLLLPEHWLLPPEMGAKEKENLRLKAEVKDLKRNQPEIKLTLEVELPDDFKALIVSPLDEHEHYDLANAVRARFVVDRPEDHQDRHIPDFIAGFSGDGSHRKYRDETIPSWVKQLSASLQTISNQLRFTITIENVGPVTANGLVAEVTIGGGRFDTVFHASDVGAPRPPKRQNIFAIPVPNHMPFPRNPGDHELHWGVKPGRSPYGELHCKEFRQGRRVDVVAFMEVQPLATNDLSIAVRVTASNLHGDVQETWAKTLAIRKAHFSELFDTGKLRFLGDYPLKERLQTAAGTRDRSWIRFPERE
ncbi:hypothetical protein CPY51_30555 [Rhizobium tubonense]|uniref:PIN domain-containing protein n=2 Tax=Rhizobium tubonense TaxID=484088 RepID=A0A2W4DVT3_9HYPH|nr:hypothetical protein CPY51_30555 [Rhizobium tubonense]